MTHNEKIGGRLAHFLELWSFLTDDQWVLDSVREGVRIPFESTPFQSRPGVNMHMSPEMKRICGSEVLALLEKGAIERIPKAEEGFLSGIFVITKS